MRPSVRPSLFVEALLAGRGRAAVGNTTNEVQKPPSSAARPDGTPGLGVSRRRQRAETSVFVYFTLAHQFAARGISLIQAGGRAPPR